MHLTSGLHPFLLISFFAFLLAVSADQISKNVTVSSSNTNFVYSGSDWSHIQGITCGDDASWASSSTVGDSVSLHFIGASGLTLFGTSSTDSAKIRITIDNTTPSDLDLSAVVVSSPQCFPIVQISSLDSAASHVITVQHLGPGVNSQDGKGLFAVSHAIVQQIGTASSSTSATSSATKDPSSATISTAPISSTATVSSQQPTTSLLVTSSHGNSKGGLIAGVVVALLVVLFATGAGLFVLRRNEWWCWRRKGPDRDPNGGISSDSFFSGGISHKAYEGGISNTSQPTFDKSPPFEGSVESHSDEMPLHVLVEKGTDFPGDGLIVPALPKDRSSYPSIIVQDYDSSRHIQPSRSNPEFATEAGPSRSTIASSASSSRRRSKLISKFSMSPTNSPNSLKFDIDPYPSFKFNNEAANEGSIRSGRSGMSRYSGITVKMATREVLRAEQPQFSSSLSARALEEGKDNRI